MKEKMLVTQALDERDLLVKKINSKIDKLKLVDTKKRNEEKTYGERLEVEEFKKEALSAYQQITDLIDRYQRLDAAIVASNAVTYIDTENGAYSVAGAIALRNRLKGDGIYMEQGSFEESLIEQFEEQYKQAVASAASRNSIIERQAEDMRMSILGRDNKTKDDKPLEVVDAYIKENTTEVIDPLGAEKKIQELKERNDALINELNTKIKVSNATTMIEF
ncbi:MAG: hypothetical protein IK151_04335 [Erysipelotrichaceae bacterium]|nr:hypothetical protein [Erysipelotrichaceae bacterium]